MGNPVLARRLWHHAPRLLDALNEGLAIRVVVHYRNVVTLYLRSRIHEIHTHNLINLVDGVIGRR